MSVSTPLPPKKDVVLALLESTDVFVHLDPRTESVKVPAWFKHQPQLVLQIGLNMPVPIPDLEVDDDAVSCTLSFNRSPFFCFVPWQSVYALVGADGRAMVSHNLMVKHSEEYKKPDDHSSMNKALLEKSLFKNEKIEK